MSGSAILSGTSDCATTWDDDDDDIVMKTVVVMMMMMMIVNQGQTAQNSSKEILPS